MFCISIELNMYKMNESLCLRKNSKAARSIRQPAKIEDGVNLGGDEGQIGGKEELCRLQQVLSETISNM